jgi:hypothetical protein
MIISDVLKYLFVSNSKACTHTMYSHLVEHYDGARLYGTGYDYHCVPQCSYPDHHVWTIVRNPYSRAVAIWWNAPQKERVSFVDFCKWLASRVWDSKPQSNILPPQAERMAGIRFDSILHLENLNADFKLLPFVPSFASSLPQMNASDYGDYRNWYDDAGRAAESVRQWASVDFDVYSYSRNFEYEAVV